MVYKTLPREIRDEIYSCLTDYNSVMIDSSKDRFSSNAYVVSRPGDQLLQDVMLLKGDRYFWNASAVGMAMLCEMAENYY